MLRRSLTVTVLWALAAASWPAASPADVSHPVVHERPANTQRPTAPILVACPDHANDLRQTTSR
jgi:hypothetical protein